MLMPLFSTQHPHPLRQHTAQLLFLSKEKKELVTYFIASFVHYEWSFADVIPWLPRFLFTWKKWRWGCGLGGFFVCSHGQMQIGSEHVKQTEKRRSSVSKIKRKKKKVFFRGGGVKLSSMNITAVFSGEGCHVCRLWCGEKR